MIQITNKQKYNYDVYQLTFKENCYEVKFNKYSDFIVMEYIKYICSVFDKQNINIRTLNKIEDIEYKQIYDLLKEEVI